MAFAVVVFQPNQNWTPDVFFSEQIRLLGGRLVLLPQGISTPSTESIFESSSGIWLYAIDGGAEILSEDVNESAPDVLSKIISILQRKKKLAQPCKSSGDFHDFHEGEGGNGCQLSPRERRHLQKYKVYKEENAKLRVQLARANRGWARSRQQVSKNLKRNQINMTGVNNAN